MNRSRLVTIVTVALALSFVAMPLLTADAQTTRPARTTGRRNPNNRPATQPAPAAVVTPTPVVPPPPPPDPVVTLLYDTPAGANNGKALVNRDALVVIAGMLNAYTDLKGLNVYGTESKELAATGKLTKTTHQFTLTWFPPNFFKTEQRTEDGGTKTLLQAGSTGKDIYSYDKGHDSYTTAPAPADRLDPDSDRVTAGILNDAVDIAGLPVLFLMAKDPKMTMIRQLQASKIELGPETPVGDRPCQTIKITHATGTTTLLVDPKTHLVVREEAAIADPAKPDTQFNRVYDYTTAPPNADLGAAAFAWTPPATAHNTTTAGAAAVP